MSSKYKITNAGGKTDSPDLEGLEIVETADGFELVQPFVVLAKSTPGPKGKALASFKLKHFKGWDWTVEIKNATPLGMNGTWSNSNPVQGPSEESDVWVASGTGTEPTDDEARAAHGK